jgi:Aspartyl protease
MSRNIFAAFFALMAWNGAAAAQTPAPPAQTDETTCALPAVAVSAELNQIAGSDLVTVPVKINGNAKQFLLAVSANPSSVSSATVSDLKLIEGIKRTEMLQTSPASQDDNTPYMTVGATMQITMIDARNNPSGDTRPRVNVPAFTIGGATGKNMAFAVAADNEIARGAPYDGIATGDFFKQYDVELDFTAMKINYLTPNKCSDPHQVVFWPHKEVAIIPMDMVDNKIEVQVDIAGHKINAVIDTASAHTVMRRDIAENTLGLKADSPQMPPAGDMKDGSDMQIYNASFPQITFAGGVTAFNVPALIQVNGMTHNLHKEAILGSRAQFKASPRIPALTLGMDVLRQLHLYVVYGQKNIYMTAAG